MLENLQASIKSVSAWLLDLSTPVSFNPDSFNPDPFNLEKYDRPHFSFSYFLKWEGWTIGHRRLSVFFYKCTKNTNTPSPCLMHIFRSDLNWLEPNSQHLSHFREKTGSIWTVPSDLFAKKIHFSFSEVVDSC